MSPASLYRTDL